MEAQIDQLYDTLLRVETESDNKDLLNWVENICQKQFGMVDSLVGTFIQNIDEPAFAKKLLKVLKKLNEYLPELIVPQFMENTKFPEAIMRYLENTKLEDLAGDAFILLVNVFNDNSIDQSSEKFVKSIIKAMEYIKDESTLNALSSILVILCSAYEKKQQKLDALNESSEKVVNFAYLEFLDSESFYRQKLLHLTNRGNCYRFDKCLDTISIILSKEASQDFFNINDLNVLMDICLQEIQKEKDKDVRVQILRMMETIIDHEMYRTYPYKLDDIREIIDELILYEDESQGEGYSPKEKEYISKLNLKFQMINI